MLDKIQIRDQERYHRRPEYFIKKATAYYYANREEILAKLRAERAARGCKVKGPYKRRKAA